VGSLAALSAVKSGCSGARTETIEKITSAKLQSEMLEAIDLLEKQFTLKQ
jgi:hypothetical protein